MKKRYLFLALSLLVSIAFAQSTITGNGGQGGAIFEAGGSARSLAMGQAYSAIGGQPEIILYNPAGLGQMHTTHIGLMGGLLYAGAMQSVLAASMPLATYGTFGLAYTGAFAQLETPLDEYGNPIPGKAAWNNSGLIFGYGKKLKVIGVGIAPKFQFGTLADKSALAFDVDAGAIFYPASVIPNWNYDILTLGVAMKNLLGSTMDYTGNDSTPATPRIFKAGLGIKVPGDFVVGGFDIALGLDSSKGFDWAGGIELNPHDMLSIRGGINNKFVSGGLGLHLDLARSMGLDVDYAIMMNYVTDGMVDPVHKVSINLELLNVAGLWVTVTPTTLTSTEYADISVYGADRYYGKIRSWVFEIVDQLGKVRYRQQREVKDIDRDALPSEFKWSGLDNITGGQVKNGWYFYRFTIIDNLGDQIVYKGKLLRVERS